MSKDDTAGRRESIDERRVWDRRCPLACANVCVSIKGRPYTWLRASLQRGDLAGVRCAAIELRQVNLADALAIVLLMSANQDPAYQRAATRWLTVQRSVVVQHAAAASQPGP
jgi:hypothetical protein